MLAGIGRAGHFNHLWSPIVYPDACPCFLQSKHFIIEIKACTSLHESSLTAEKKAPKMLTKSLVVMGHAPFVIKCSLRGMRFQVVE